jgi:hypothetical protein
VLAVVVLATLAFVVVAFLSPSTETRQFSEPAEVDWRLVPASVLILFALWILAGLALACSTRFEMIPTLAICTGIFFLGLMSDYLFGSRAEPVWNADLQTELASPNRTEEQRALLKTVAERYDRDQDGRLNRAEQGAMSEADKRGLRRAGLGRAWWAAALYSVLPNWQLFWPADALEGKGRISWGYVGTALGYVVGYLGASLALALWLFEDRELS